LAVSILNQVCKHNKSHDIGDAAMEGRAFMKRTLMLIVIAMAALALQNNAAITSVSAANPLPEQGVKITGFAGEALFNAIPKTGEINCLGGKPTGRSSPPFCEPNSKTKVRGRQLTGTIKTSDPRTTGSISVVINMDLDSSSFTGDV
jgi:hypothetical protein